ncbi:hypothetical protein, partial [Streptomyces sp. SID3343]|uniref:hypothetical protein n=1 Tax=Streptomyces sp. SID3343 TaxID=2690260 RepID=UPI001F1C1F53
EREEWRPILRFSSLRDPVEIARFVEMHVVDPQSRNWLRGLRAAERYRRNHPPTCASPSTASTSTTAA